MAYTQADLDAIRAAEVKQAQGRMPTRITIDGQTIQYAEMGAEARRALKNDIIRALTKRRRRAFRVYADKGL